MCRPTQLALLIFSCLLASASAQFGGLGGKRIQGQIRVDGQPAPQGVLVYLDHARGRDTSFVNGSGELGNTMTDSRGKFSFENIDAGQEEPEGRLYIVTARYPGYRTATQIVDLTASPVGYVHLDLRRDTSKDVPNVPPGGPGAMISARQPESPKAQEELAKGEDLLIQKHDPRGSITEFKKLLQLDPQYGPGYVLMGTAHMQLREWREARSAFEKAAKLEPTNAAAFLGMGAAMNQQQEFKAAQKPLQRSLDLRPDSAQAQYELGRSFWGQRQWQQAEPCARKALEIDKSFPPAHLLMGNVFLRHRDAPSALSEFQEYLRLDPKGQHAEEVKALIARIQKALGQR